MSEKHLHIAGGSSPRASTATKNGIDRANESNPNTDDELMLSEGDLSAASSMDLSSDDENDNQGEEVSADLNRTPGHSKKRPRDPSSTNEQESSIDCARGQYSAVNDSWLLNYNGIIVILPIIFNAFHDRTLERSYQRYSHGQRQKSLIIAHLLDLLLKLGLLSTPLIASSTGSLLSQTNKNQTRGVELREESAMFGPLAALKWPLSGRQLELLAANYYLAGAFCTVNSVLVTICLFLPHRYLTERLSCMALMTWLLMCLQTYLIYNNVQPDLSGALEFEQIWSAANDSDAGSTSGAAGWSAQVVSCSVWIQFAHAKYTPMSAPNGISPYVTQTSGNACMT